MNIRKRLMFLAVFCFTASAAFAAGSETLKSGDFSLKLPLGLSAKDVMIPADNPMSREKVELGRALYFDKRLSADDTVACATCHAPANGFTDNLPVSSGIKGQKGGRSAPTVINRAFSDVQFWDGRAATLEAQAKGPITNPIEMGIPNHDVAVKKIAAIKGYAEWFKKVFGKDVNIDDMARAIAAFERTVVSGNSKYDRYQVGDKKALSAGEKRGLDIFEGKGNCIRCHGGANFTDEEYHNIGVGMSATNPDLGRYVVTKKEEDKGAFKTPTLRDISATAPYMHDGSDKTLMDVVEFYDKGGAANANLSKRVEKLGLTAQEKKDLVAFMEALSGEGWRHITAPKEFPK